MVWFQFRSDGSLSGVHEIRRSSVLFRLAFRIEVRTWIWNVAMFALSFVGV